MKKSTKIILITSLCLILVGITITGIAAAVGGFRQYKELAQKKALDFDLPWDGLQLRLNTDGIYLTSEEDERPFDEPEVSGHTESLETVDPGNIKNIEMELGAGEIEIRKSESGSFRVEDSENIDITSDFKDGTLRIRAGISPNIQILGVSTNVGSAGSAVLYLPDLPYEKISIELGAGVCEGTIPNCKELSVDMGAGEFTMDYLKADDIEFSLGAGECNIDRIDAKELAVDIAMGEFNVGALVEKEMDVKVGMGEANIDVVGTEEEFDYEVEVGAGEVRIGSRKYSGVGNRGQRNNGMGREIDVECGMGEATIRFVEK